MYCSGEKIFLTTYETAMVISKQNISKPGGRKKPRSSNSTEENGKHTGTKHGPSQISPNMGVGQKIEKEWSKRIRRSQEETKGVLWCSLYIKEKTGENYKEAYELWRERNSMARKNMGENLLLNQ